MTKDELEKEIGKLEGKLADLTSEYYELENLKDNEIAELKAYNEKLLDGDIEKHNKIVELQRENEELEAENEANKNGAEKYAEFYFETNDKLTKAKEIIRELLFTSNELDENTRSKAEQFLKEVEENA